MLCSNLASSPNHWGSISDNMACPKGDQPLGGYLHAVLDKIEADILQNTKKRNQKWII